MNKLTLFENVFSPFARKVRMVLEYKGLEFEEEEDVFPDPMIDPDTISSGEEEQEEDY